MLGRSYGRINDIETELTTEKGHKLVVYTRFRPDNTFPYQAYVGMCERSGKTRREAVTNLLTAIGETLSTTELDKVPGN